MIEFTFKDVKAMLADAMKSGRQPATEQIEELMLMTNMVAASLDANRENREKIGARDVAEAAVATLRSYHQHLAEYGVDVTRIETEFGNYLDRLPILVDPTGARAEIDHSDDDLSLSDISRLSESLALACHMAFTPRDGLDAPSLKSDSTATRYAGIVIGKLTGQRLSGGAVKQNHLRFEEWRAQRRQTGIKT